MRLDRFLANSGVGTRKEVKDILKKRKIKVNDDIISNGSIHVKENEDIVKYNDEVINYRPFVYIMMNKPDGVISATEDKEHKTVIDLLGNNYRTYSLFPVGRLDKDTEGLMLLTNDGELAHKLISPKKDVEKKYYVEVSGELKNEHLEIVKEGVTLEDGYKCKPARLEILDTSEGNSKANIFITEGKFHQVKRMMKSLGTTVTYLKRLSIGSLKLDENLKLGEYRYLTDDELNKLTK